MTAVAELPSSSEHFWRAAVPGAAVGRRRM